MKMINPTSPFGLLLLLLDTRRARVRDERGASAVEWVVIAAIVVTIVVAVGVLLDSAIRGRAQEAADQISG